MPAPADSRVPRPLRALRHRNYQLFFGGQLISLTGTWMQSVAQSWLVYRLTGSAALLGVVGFAGQIPVFLMAPIGGAVADARARHPILVATQTLSMLLAFVLAGLTLAGHVAIWQRVDWACGLRGRRLRRPGAIADAGRHRVGDRQHRG